MNNIASSGLKQMSTSRALGRYVSQRPALCSADSRKDRAEETSGAHLAVSERRLADTFVGGRVGHPSKARDELRSIRLLFEETPITRASCARECIAFPFASWDDKSEKDCQNEHDMQRRRCSRRKEWHDG